MKVIIIGGGIGGLRSRRGCGGPGVESRCTSGTTASAAGGRATGSTSTRPVPEPCTPPAGRGLAGVPRDRRAGRRLRVPHRAARRAGRRRGVDHVPGRRRSTENHYAADRATLRRVLSTGLEDVVRYGAEYVGYTHLPDGRVRGAFRRRAHRRRRRAGRRGRAGVAGAPRSCCRRSRPVDAGVVGVGAQDLARRGPGRAAARLGTGMNVDARRRPVLPVHRRCSSRRGTGARPYLLCALVARPELLPPDVTELDRTRCGSRWTCSSPAGTRGCAARWPRPTRESRSAVTFRATAPAAGLDGRPGHRTR